MSLRLVPVLALLAVAGALAGAAGSETGGGAPKSQAIVARDYDLGVQPFPQPGLTGRLSSMPIRLWGTIAAPAGPGPHPVVVVAHGAHGDNCPVVMDADTWPCWKQERRSDLGFRWLVRALAKAGFVAVAPDVNAAYSGGWGEIAGKEERRFRQVVDATVAELALASAGARTEFGLSLQRKVDLSRLGLLGHSRGGMNVLAWATQENVRSVFLVRPFADPAKRIGRATPATVLLGTCDFDTRLEGGRYFAALRGKPRGAPAYQVVLTGANHNSYNQTLVTVGNDDAAGAKGACGPARRVTASRQQAFLRQLAIDHFRVTLLGAAPAAWMTSSPAGLYGERAAIQAVRP